MGDLEIEGWQYLCSKPVDLRSDVLKFPHHGAWKNADPNLLLDAIELSVRSFSRGN
jgi:beta-lactamase superfamily II metal-dependent hydrolase